MKGFQKYIPEGRGKPRTSSLSQLGVGEMWFFPKDHKALYRRVYYHEKKYGKVFSYMEIKNGVIVKRDA